MAVASLVGWLLVDILKYVEYLHTQNSSTGLLNTMQKFTLVYLIFVCCCFCRCYLFFIF